MMVTAVAIILIIIIGITNKDRLSLTKFEKIIGNILSPINKIGYSIGNKVSGFFGALSNLSNLQEENEELLIRVAELEEENRDLINLVGKYDFLKNEAGLMDRTNYNMISAQITSKEAGNNWYDIFLIDKGLKDGVEKGDNVIQGIEIENDIIEEGIVGRIVDVGDNWAKVVSIVDEHNKMSFKIIRTQDGGILQGIDGVISGYLFDSEADVVPGDKIYTSGLGGTFHKDLYIGEVDEVQEIQEELMKKIIVKPAIDFKKLFRVFVIID